MRASLARRSALTVLAALGLAPAGRAVAAAKTKVAARPDGMIGNLPVLPKHAPSGPRK